MVTINGTELDIAGTTLAEYLAAENYDSRRIAVERNGDIVPKAEYGQTVTHARPSAPLRMFPQ